MVASTRGNKTTTKEVGSRTIRRKKQELNVDTSSGMKRSKERERNAAVVYHVALMLNPKYLLRDAMIFAGFDVKEAKDRKIQMRVRRFHDDLQIKGRLHDPSKVFVDDNLVGKSVEALSCSPSSTISEESSFSSSEISSLAAKKSSNSSDSSSRVGKRTYRTTRQIHAQNHNRVILKQLVNEARKRASQMYQTHQGVSGDAKLTAPQVAEIVKRETGIKIPDRTIRNDVQQGNAGKTPPRAGNPGRIKDQAAYDALCGGMGSYLEISQVNGEKEKSKNALKNLVNHVVSGHPDEKGKVRKGSSLIDRILSEPKLALVLECDHKEKKQEVRRNLWCTYFNLDDWFSSFKEYLIANGFAVDANQFEDPLAELLQNPDKYDNDEYDEDLIKENELIFLKGKKKDICNLDETGLGMGGVDGAQGGRPSPVYYNPKFGRPGSGFQKGATSATLVAGANGANELFPPHLQLWTAAKSDSTTMIEAECLRTSSFIDGTWGLDAPEEKPCSFGANLKGGMDTDWFGKVLDTMIVPLYPKARPRFGEKVCILTDMGPGRKSKELATKLRLLGFDLFPLLPNSSALSQLMDQLFSHFKTLFRKNIAELSEHVTKKAHGKEVSFSRPVCSLLVFGGKICDDEDTSPILENAVKESFTDARIREAWNKIGMIPFTRRLLENPAVRHEITTSEGTVEESLDPQAVALKHLEERNHLCCEILNSFGYNGDILKLDIKTRSLEAHLKRRHAQGSKERQLALANAKTAGQLFNVGGGPLTCDDKFIGEAIKENQAEVERLEKRKKAWAEHSDFLLAVTRVKDEKLGAGVNKLVVQDLKLLIKSKGGDASGKKADLLQKWESVKDNPDVVWALPWTELDEADLTERKSREFDMKDTSVGRAVRQNECLLLNTLDEELVSKEFLEEIQSRAVSALENMTKKAATTESKPSAKVEKEVITADETNAHQTSLFHVPLISDVPSSKAELVDDSWMLPHSESIIRSYGRVVNVADNGNCGYYAIQRGLADLGLSYEQNISDFRRGIYKHGKENQDKLLKSECYKFGRTIHARRRQWETLILNPIYDPTRAFDTGTTPDFWMDSGYVLPIIVDKFQVPVVVYALIDNADEDVTTSTFNPLSGGGAKLTVEKGLHPPVSSMAIYILHTGVHYMYLAVCG